MKQLSPISIDSKEGNELRDNQFAFWNESFSIISVLNPSSSIVLNHIYIYVIPVIVSEVTCLNDPSIKDNVVKLGRSII